MPVLKHYDPNLGQWVPVAIVAPSPAAGVPVLDTANQFTGTNVETVLAEIQDNVDALVISGGGMAASSAAEVAAATINTKAVTPLGLATALPRFDVRRYGDPATNLRAAIVAAHTAAAAAGGEVWIPPGAWTFTGATIDIGSTDVTIAAAPGATITTGEAVPVFTVENASNVRFTGLHLVGTGQTYPALQVGIAIKAGCTDITVDHCHIDGMAYDGIYSLDSCEGLLIAHNVVENCGDDGINPGGGTTAMSYKAKVIGNTVRNCAHDGIHVSSKTADLTIIGNTVEGCEIGIALNACTKALVKGNTIRGASNYGIATTGTNTAEVAVEGNLIVGCDQSIRITENQLRTSIVGNLIVDPVEWGIVLTGATAVDREYLVANNLILGTPTNRLVYLNNCRNVLVTGNYLYGDPPIAVEFTNTTDVTFHGNYINGADTYAVQTSTANTNLTISANTIRGHDDYGINIVAGTVTNLAIDGNTIVGGTRGISSAGCTRFRITNNRIYSATTYGIVVSAAALNSHGGQIAGNTVADGLTATNGGIYINLHEDVDIVDNHVIDVAGVAHGIIVLASTDVLVQGNHVTNSGGDGIQVTGACTAVTVRDNHVTGCTNYGVHSTATITDLIVSGNTIRNCARGVHMAGTPTRFAIDGNTILTCTAYGVVLSAGSLNSNGGSVAGNRIHGGVTTAGIYVNNFSLVAVDGNRILGIDGAANGIQGFGSTDSLLVVNNMSSEPITAIGAGSTASSNVPTPT